MSETEVTVNVSDGGTWTDSLPLLIVLIAIVIAVIFFLFGLQRLRRRRHAHENEHLVVDMAEPETLRDADAEPRSGR